MAKTEIHGKFQSHTQLQGQIYRTQWTPNLKFLFVLGSQATKDFKNLKTFHFHPELHLVNCIKLCPIFCNCTVLTFEIFEQVDFCEFRLTLIDCLMFMRPKWSYFKQTKQVLTWIKDCANLKFQQLNKLRD